MDRFYSNFELEPFKKSQCTPLHAFARLGPKHAKQFEK